MGNICNSKSRRKVSNADFDDDSFYHRARVSSGKKGHYQYQAAPTEIQSLSAYQNSIASFNYPSDLKIGSQAPRWTATAVFGNGDMREIRLDDYKGRYVVLFFYPMDFTFVCPTEILAFSDRSEEFKEINCDVIAASTDSKYSHFQWISIPRIEGGLGHLEIPLVADKNCEIARKYGIYKADEGISWRGLFIIDSQGKLRQITVNDLAVGRSVDETLRLVQAFQYTDKYGEVCPANWKPGEKGIKIGQQQPKVELIEKSKAKPVVKPKQLAVTIIDE